MRARCRRYRPCSSFGACRPHVAGGNRCCSLPSLHNPLEMLRRSAAGTRVEWPRGIDADVTDVVLLVEREAVSLIREWARDLSIVNDEIAAVGGHVEPLKPESGQRPQFDRQAQETIRPFAFPLDAPASVRHSNVWTIAPDYRGVWGRFWARRCSSRSRRCPGRCPAQSASAIRSGRPNPAFALPAVNRSTSSPRNRRAY